MHRIAMSLPLAAIASLAYVEPWLPGRAADRIPLAGIKAIPVGRRAPARGRAAHRPLEKPDA